MSQHLPNNINCNVEQSCITFCRMKSLLHMSVVKIVVHFCTKTKVAHKILSHNVDLYKYSQLCNLERHRGYVMKELQHSSIPQSFYCVFSDVAKTVLKEIYIWKDFYHHHFNVKTNEFEHLVWTSRGSINFAESMKNVLMKVALPLLNKKFTLLKIFELACGFCLVDLIQSLSPALSRLDGSVFSNITFGPMTYFWVSTITLNGSKLRDTINYCHRMERANESINEAVFKSLSAWKSYPDFPMKLVGVEFIWNLLTDEEQNRNITALMNSNLHADLKCRVLSGLNFEQQDAAFRLSADRIIISIYDSGLWTDHLVPTVHRAIPNISAEQFLSVLQPVFIGAFIRFVQRGCTTNTDTYLFEEIWKLSPSLLRVSTFMCPIRKVFINILRRAYDVVRMLEKFLIMGRYDLLSLVLKDCPSRYRKKVLISLEVCKLLGNLIEENKWDRVNEYLALCFYSVREIKSLKRFFLGHGASSVLKTLASKGQWDQVDRLFDWICASDGVIMKYRKKIAWYCLDIWISDCFMKDCVDTSLIENVLIMCLKSEEMMNDFRMSRVENVCEHIILIQFNCMGWKKCLVTNDILNWCFFNDLTKLENFKKNLYSNISYLSMLWTCMKRNDWDTADNFVQWCCNGCYEEIKSFKNSVMVQTCEKSLLTFVNEVSILTKILQWFDPTLETALKCKEKFLFRCDRTFDTVVQQFESFISELRKREQ